MFCEIATYSLRSAAADYQVSYFRFSCLTVPARHIPVDTSILPHQRIYETDGEKENRLPSQLSFTGTIHLTSSSSFVCTRLLKYRVSPLTKPLSTAYCS